MNQMNLSRRKFLQTSAAAGGGMMLGFHVPTAFASAGGVEINAWLTIDPMGIVTIVTPQTEMGSSKYGAVYHG